MSDVQRVAASFRDPSGFLFSREGILYRQVNRSYQKEYERLMDSGLYSDLVESGYLIPHTEVNEDPANTDLAYKVIQPEPVGFISYPYEWGFSQYKDAALLTLEIEKRALAHGMSLKDASAYNVQFQRGHPVLVDTISFEIYQEGKPWVAYRQFCQHFLAPLALMVHVDIRMNQWLRIYIDGVPLDLASRLLPRRTRWNFPLLTHIHMHASAQKRYAGKAPSSAALSRGMSKVSFMGLIYSLETAIRKLAWQPTGTEWVEYYTETNYTEDGFAHKRQLVEQFLLRIQPKTVWDLGANTGIFSRIASERGIATLAFDVDPAAVELNYLACKEKGEANLLPLLMDLTNPSPSLGWQNQERMSLQERGKADALLALALIHHLAISNNVPLENMASFFHALTRWLIVEFIPKSDSQVQRLLSTRDDIFSEYHQEGFERGFSSYFTIHATTPIRGSQRILYLMEAR